MALEAAKTKICGEIFQRGTQMYTLEENVTEINEPSRSKAFITDTHKM